MTAPFPFPGLRNDVLLPLPLRRADGPLDAALCLAAAGADQPYQLRERRHDFLHAQELERLAAMTADRRAGDFLVGRYACKRAIAHMRPRQDVRDACIVPGVFTQPVLQSPAYLGLQVSISHTTGIGAAIAAPDTHPMAIDVEHYALSSCDAIASQLTVEELAHVSKLGSTGLPRVKAMTTLWAMKEALSKVLRCGLMVPFTLLELDRFEHAGAQLTGWFRHFSQYKAVAIDLGEFTCAVALPRETHGLDLQALLPAFSLSSL